MQDGIQEIITYGACFNSAHFGEMFGMPFAVFLGGRFCQAAIKVHLEETKFICLSCKDGVQSSELLSDCMVG